LTSFDRVNPDPSPPKSCPRVQSSTAAAYCRHRRGRWPPEMATAAPPLLVSPTSRPQSRSVLESVKEHRINGRSNTCRTENKENILESGLTLPEIGDLPEMGRVGEPSQLHHHRRWSPTPPPRISGEQEEGEGGRVPPLPEKNENKRRCRRRWKEKGRRRPPPPPLVGEREENSQVGRG
jgi:hypothetical protein